MNIEIGIPVLSDSKGGHRKVSELRRAGFQGKIHLSINKSDFAEANSSARDPLLRVTQHAENLGLYGNFKYLIESSTCELFLWLAMDDEFPEELVRNATEGSGHVADLTVGKVSTFDSKTGEELESNDPTIMSDLFSPNPSAIFGVWRTDWLKGVFPSKPFDWLDVFLVTATMRLGSIKSDEVATLRIAWSPKTPHHVNNKYHQPWLWAVHAIKLVRNARDFVLFSHSFAGKIVFSARSWFQHIFRRFPFRRFAA